MAIATHETYQTAHSAPGPRYWSPLTYYRNFRAGGLDYIDGLHREYGPFVQIKMFPFSIFLIQNPDACRDILVTNIENYPKGKIFERLKVVGGNGLFFSDGEIWKKNRRIIGPYFKRGNMEKYLNAIMAAGEATVDKIETRGMLGHELEYSDIFAETALDVVGRAFLGMNFGSRIETLLQAVNDTMDFGQNLLYSIVPMTWLPTKLNRQGKRGLRLMYKTIDELIDEAMHREVGDDLLSILVDAVRSGEMTKEHLTEEMWTIINAGHETTATTMSLMLYFLGKNTEWQRAVQQELDEVLGAGPLTFEKLKKIEKIHWTTQETLRLYPPAWSTAREVRNNDVLSGFKVPKGSIVQTTFLFAQRNSEYFQKPDDFIPERFGPMANEYGNEDAYNPFGAGGRRCLGEHFAYLETLVIITQLLRKYSVSTDPDFEVEPYLAGALRFKNGIRYTLDLRESSSLQVSGEHQNSERAIS